MQLSEDSIATLEELLQCAISVKIDKLLITDSIISGIDEDKSVVVISESRVPDFGGLTVGLRRLSTLNSRISLAKTGENFKFSADESGAKAGEVALLKLVSKNSKAEFVTTNPDKIKAPKRVNDKPNWLVSIAKDLVPTITQAAASIGTDKIILTSKPDGTVHFELIDDKTRDTIAIQVADHADWIPEDEEAASNAFVHYYSSKSILPLIKMVGETGDVNLIISEKGMLTLDVNGFTFTNLPRIASR